MIRGFGEGNANADFVMLNKEKHLSNLNKDLRFAQKEKAYK